MIAFGLTLRRFIKGIIFSWANPHFRATLALIAIILFSGTMFYRTVEGWAWVDAFYFSVMTAATIGFGDLAPTTPFSKLFTVVYAIVSIGAFVALVTHMATAMTQPKDQKRDDGDAEGSATE